MRLASSFLLAIMMAIPASVSAQVIKIDPGPNNTVTYTFSYPGPVQLTQTPSSVTFLWGQTPPPPPPPNPPGVPTLTGDAWALVVFDGTVPPPVAISKTVSDAAKALNITIQAVPKTDPLAVGYATNLADVTLPGVLIIQTGANGKGDVKYKTTLSKTEADFIALLTSLRPKAVPYSQDSDIGVK